MGKRIIRFLIFLMDCVLECVYPHKDKCLICDGILQKEFLCSKCFMKIYFLKDEVVIRDLNLNVKSVAIYSSTMKKLLLKFKYEKDFYSGEFLSTMMVEFINYNNIFFDVITYVPSSKKALKLRGFNQCEFVANFIGGILDKKVLFLIKRDKESSEQKRLSKDERKMNLFGVFSYNTSININGKTILLIDDIITTGYTLKFCKDILIENGAKEIILLTIAKSNV